MRYARLLALLAMLGGCAEGGINGGPDSSTGSDSGGPADCIQGVTCAQDCIDLDGDGFGTGCALGPDCDDGNPRIAPNAGEPCDGEDNDCNGLIDDATACGGTPTPTNNTTMPGTTCADADGDGYGVGCALGVDCDDGDNERFDGAPEACDGKDNDCDGSVDEDFELGMSCSSGLGQCAANGTLRCSADGTMADCSAVEGAPSTEVCDGLDNDCDGVPDDGLNCNVCVEDSHEPDDSSLTGTTLNVGDTLSGQLCGGNVDWFRLGSYTAGQTVSVTVTFSHAQGDINMEMYVGSTFEAGAYSTTDNESITQTLSKSGNVAVRLYYRTDPGVTGNGYTIRR